MRVLVAGGSKFIGRNLVEMLLAEGHEVTLFNRGKTSPGLFPEAQEIHGDRQDPPAELAKHDWDWVLDMSGYKPADVDKLAGLVGPRTGRYVFVSTCSVYDWDGTDTPLTEKAKLIPYIPENLTPETHMARSYGANKTGCEEALFRMAAATGMEASIVRPVLVYGPYDPTDRFHWWLHRVKEGAVIRPTSPAGTVHQVYVKDLCRIFLGAAKAKVAAGRIYNGCSTRHATLEDWINTAAQVLGTQPRIVEVPQAELEAAGVKGLPGLTGPQSLKASTERIEADLGFTATPFADTLRETYAFMEREGRPIKEAIAPEAMAKFL